MLIKKKPVLLWMLTIADESSRTLYEGPLFCMQFSEETIKALSIEFFRDPEPCHIHRSAVIQRAMMEIEAACQEGVPVAISTLPLRIAGFFACYQDARTLTLAKEEKRL